MSRSLFLFVILLSCETSQDQQRERGNSYGQDLSFLQSHDKSIIELASPDGNSRAILSSRYQGRVMTTTSTGKEGNSYGWINYDLIQSGEINPQFNPIGGEERLWLGPEGGQFSLFFAPGDSFKIDNWQVPYVIDTITYKVTSKNDESATFEARGQLTNYSGNKFDIALMRTVELLGREDVGAELGVDLTNDVKVVGYRTTNRLENAGNEQWSKETGLVSIWLLGMLTPSPFTTVIIPFDKAADPTSINTDYFGDIPSDRIAIKDGVLLLKADGNFRSKVGLPPHMLRSVAGSYDSERQILTIIKFSFEKGSAYVNNKWEIQSDPFDGDAVNAYNDGPLGNGSQLGPFYELESCSPAFELLPGQGISHPQVTFHFEGNQESLNYLMKTLLSTEINDLKIQP
jgi:hypothetical protein